MLRDDEVNRYWEFWSMKINTGRMKMCRGNNFRQSHFIIDMDPPGARDDGYHLVGRILHRSEIACNPGIENSPMISFRKSQWKPPANYMPS
jgi:hypothetical protein